MTVHLHAPACQDILKMTICLLPALVLLLQTTNLFSLKMLKIIFYSMKLIVNGAGNIL